MDVVTAQKHPRAPSGHRGGHGGSAPSRLLPQPGQQRHPPHWRDAILASAGEPDCEGKRSGFSSHQHNLVSTFWLPEQETTDFFISCLP